MSTAHAPAAPSSVRDYCPNCDERTSLTTRGRCPWCSTPLTALGQDAYRPPEPAVDRPVPTPRAPVTAAAPRKATPERSLEQRMDALDRANKIRSRRAQLKRDLKAGRERIHDHLLDAPDWLETAKVFDLLLAVPKYGRVKVNKILVQCRISPSKSIGGLTERQRIELVSMIRRPV